MPITGKRLLVAPHEWGENIAFLTAFAERAGARVEALPFLDFTAPDLSGWQAVIDEDVAAIFRPMVTSVADLYYPVEAIGALERPTVTQIIIDAAQALGQVEVDVARLGCDALFGITRKWSREPRQTAIFWTKDAAQVTELEPSMRMSACDWAWALRSIVCCHALCRRLRPNCADVPLMRASGSKH